MGITLVQWKRRLCRQREQRKEQAKPEEKSLSVKEDAGNKKGQWKKRQVSKDVSDAPRKRKFEEVRGGEKVNGQRKRENQKKKKQGGPPEVQDKLDMLIEQ
ncbi:uncharacterized protein LOC111213435 [Brassica napus]|uniref:uncharacterized protein LOC111213435 n=1 Tax=Brassica napus TaxID=3708 RepID=UPI0020797EC0|nr:uncharacterized protein LOC111213435 [Brassica napus]